MAIYPLAREVHELPIRPAAHLSRARPTPTGRLGYAELAGRLVELSPLRGGASLSFLCTRVREAQTLGETVAWVHTGDSVFFPPDLAANGVNLEALVVIKPGNLRGALQAVHHLLHSGAFGMVVLDTPEERDTVPQGTLGRFAHLAERNDTAMVFLREGTQEHGLGSMVSLRARTRLRRLKPAVFRCEVEVIKDKRRGPGLRVSEIYHAPAGLC
jgi:recombination protein RecA